MSQLKKNLFADCGCQRLYGTKSLHAVGGTRTSRLNTRPRDRVHNNETMRYIEKSSQFPLPNFVPFCTKFSKLADQKWQKMARRLQCRAQDVLTDSGIEIWELCSLPGLKTSGLAALLLSFSGWPASLATLKQKRAHGCSQIVRNVVHGWNLVRGDDLEV